MTTCYPAKTISPEAIYDDFITRLIPHYSEIEFSHKMPMNVVRKLFRRHLSNYITDIKNQIKHLEKLITSCFCKNDIAEYQKKITRLKINISKTAWSIKYRKIQINDFKGIKKNIGMHRCSSIYITKNRIIIKSSYTLKHLLSLLKVKVFSGINNLNTIEYSKIISMEIKTSIPVEFSDPTLLKILFPGDLFEEVRHRIKTIFATKLHPEIELVQYKLTGKKFVNNELQCGLIDRDRTKKLLVVPLEFRYKNIQKIFYNELPSRATYEATFEKLSVYTLLNFLLDKNLQAKILFLTPPEMWTNAPKMPLVQERELFTNKLIGPKLKQSRYPEWNDQDYKYDQFRINYIYELLNENPLFLKLKRQWKKKHPCFLHENNRIDKIQLTTLLHFYSVIEIDKFYKYYNELLYYFFLRTRNKIYKKPIPTLFSWFSNNSDLTITEDECKTIEQIIERRRHTPKNIHSCKY